MARTLGVGEQTRQPGLFRTPTRPSDGIHVALHPVGHDPGPLPGSDGQHGPGTSDLIPGQRLAAGDLPKDRFITGGDGYGMRSPSAHGASSKIGIGNVPQHITRPEFRVLYGPQKVCTRLLPELPIGQDEAT